MIDANVWISGLHFAKRRGIPTLALERAIGEDEIAICDEIEAEVVRVLSDKFAWTGERVAAALDSSLGDARRVKTRGASMGCRDRNDDAVLECAVIGEAQMIVTGDRDLLALHPFRGIEIVLPADYVSLR